MKKLMFLSVFVLLFVLVGCRTLDGYEHMLEEQGWTVETASVEDVPDIIDSEELEERYGISSILFAYRDDEIMFGFIIEFTSRSDARDAYEELVGEDDSEFGDYIRQAGAFVFIGSSTTFLEDLNVE